MGQVGTAKAKGVIFREARHALDRMADGARRVGPDFRPGRRRTAGRLERSLELMRGPLLERFGRIDEYPKAHVRMRSAAELRALAVILAGRIRGRCDLVLLPGDDVALASDRRHEE